ncbi:uncharacterized protein [Antedon mediterranea]|uniref:uncharacterized protein n=1 Tax=Antedon mediterranea TaxID=105859 RepID=UPI003AF7C8D1
MNSTTTSSTGRPNSGTILYLGLCIFIAIHLQMSAATKTQWNGGCPDRCKENPSKYCDEITKTCKTCSCTDGPDGKECRWKCQKYLPESRQNAWEGCIDNCQQDVSYFCDQGSRTCMECQDLCDNEPQEKCLQNCPAYLLNKQKPVVTNSWEGCYENCQYDISYFCEAGSGTCMECYDLCDAKASHYLKQNCFTKCPGYVSTFITTARPTPSKMIVTPSIPATGPAVEPETTQPPIPMSDYTTQVTNYSPTSADMESRSSHINTIYIASAIGAIILVLVVVGLLGCCLLKKSRHRPKQDNKNKPGDAENGIAVQQQNQPLVDGHTQVQENGPHSLKNVKADKHNTEYIPLVEEEDIFHAQQEAANDTSSLAVNGKPYHSNACISNSMKMTEITTTTTHPMMMHSG